MAPPPPSASYLLDIGTDSEDSAQEEHQVSENEDDSSSISKQQLDTASTDDNVTPNKKKKKRKKKRKRKKKKATQHNTCAPTGERSVTFGHVHVREYERCLGSDVVPLDGGWPLGMSPTVVNEYQVASTVDDFEERRQVELRRRWLDVMSSHVSENEPCSHNNKNTNDDSTPTSLLVPPKGDLETRQYDYRKRPHEITKSTKNPLFGPLNEDARMRLLISNDETQDADQDDASTHSTPKSPSRSPKPKRRTRSNSMHSNNNDSRQSQRRLRSHSEQYYSEQYPSSDVLHIRNELEQIRVHRTLEGSLGCTCRKLDVYLPPKDGGGKKAQHRRMKPQKVKEELRKRGKLPPNSQDVSRNELEQLLHDVVQEETCCWGEDCPCVKDGIGCQADTCSCWFDSHQKKGSCSDGTDEISVMEIRARCGNNMYAVDLDGIHNFRMQYCQVIESTTDE